MLFSPLEQFEINTIIPFYIGFIDISITNLSLYLLIVISIYYFVASYLLSSFNIIPKAYQIVVESIYDFVYGIVYENLTKKSSLFFPILLTLFCYIVTINLLGMIPYSFTPTSHVGIAFGLSFSFFIGFTLIGIYEHRDDYLNNFFPDQTPYEMSPLLVPIEIISHISKAFSLGIRLFANMMSGHTLLKIISGFSWNMFLHGGLLSIAGLIPFFVLFALVSLETGIAILQGYVFTVLVTLYINDSINLH